jgi:hypothetical protein
MATLHKHRQKGPVARVESLGFHLLRRASYSEDMLRDIICVVEYRRGYELYCGAIELAGNERAAMATSHVA